MHDCDGNMHCLRKPSANNETPNIVKIIFVPIFLASIEVFYRIPLFPHPAEIYRDANLTTLSEATSMAIDELQAAPLFRGATVLLRSSIFLYL